MKRFISLLNIVLVLSMLLTACGPATTPEVIEKVVAETVVVEKEVEVTKEVQVEVEKEVVVTPTPTLVPPMPEEVPVIELDEALEDELSGDGAVAYYRVSGPEGYDRLIVELGGPGDADFDLYVRHGAPPSLDDYDWSSTGSGSEEQIIIDDPSGKYYILVYAYTGEGPYGIGAYVEDQPQPSRWEVIQERGRVIVGLDPNLEPFSFDKDGTLQGFDVDLAHEFALRWLGDAEAVEFIAVSPEEVATYLVEGDLDMVLVGAKPVVQDAEISGWVASSQAYYAEEPFFLVLPEYVPFHSRDDLIGRTVVAITDSGALELAQILAEDLGIGIREVPSFLDAISVVENQEADAFLTESRFFAEATLSAAWDWRMEKLGPWFAYEPRVVAVAAGEEVLLGMIEATLDDMWMDYTYDEIYGYWIRLPMPLDPPNMIFPDDASVIALIEEMDRATLREYEDWILEDLDYLVETNEIPEDVADEFVVNLELYLGGDPLDRVTHYEFFLLLSGIVRTDIELLSAFTAVALINDYPQGEGFLYLLQGNTLWDDLESSWEKYEKKAYNVGRHLYKEWSSGRTGRRLCKYGKGIARGGYNMVAEPVKDLADVATITILYHTDRQSLQYYDPEGGLVKAVVQNIPADRILIQMGEAILELPERTYENIRNSNMEKLGENVADIIALLWPFKNPKLGTKPLTVRIPKANFNWVVMADGTLAAQVATGAKAITLARPVIRGVKVKLLLPLGSLIMLKGVKAPHGLPTASAEQGPRLIGEAYEDAVKGALEKGEVKGLPETKAISGHYDGQHGIDLVGVKDGKPIIIEAGGGRTKRLEVVVIEHANVRQMSWEWIQDRWLKLIDRNRKKVELEQLGIKPEYLNAEMLKAQPGLWEDFTRHIIIRRSARLKGATKAGIERTEVLRFGGK